MGTIEYGYSPETVLFYKNCLHVDLPKRDIIDGLGEFEPKRLCAEFLVYLGTREDLYNVFRTVLREKAHAVCEDTVAEILDRGTDRAVRYMAKYVPQDVLQTAMHFAKNISVERTLIP